MKTVRSLFLIAIIAVVFTGCFGGSGPSYRVEFTLNGTDYSFTEAYDISRTVAEGCKDDDGYKTLIIGKSADSNNYAYLNIPGITTGYFHDLADSSIFYFAVASGDSFRDKSDTADDFTVTITEYGDVGELIRGTFSGNVTEYNTEITYPLTDGYFEVIRRADGSIVLK